LEVGVVKRANSYFQLFLFAIPASAFILALASMFRDLKFWQALLVVSFWFPLITVSVAAQRYLYEVGPWRDQHRGAKEANR
jgi:hypothetical protein